MLSAFLALCATSDNAVPIASEVSMARSKMRAAHSKLGQYQESTIRARTSDAATIIKLEGQLRTSQLRTLTLHRALSRLLKATARVSEHPALDVAMAAAQNATATLAREVRCHATLEHEAPFGAPTLLPPLVMSGAPDGLLEKHAVCKLLRPTAGRPQRTIGAFGTSITYGAELEPVDLTHASVQAWPSVLQTLLRSAEPYATTRVINAAARGSSADFASLCLEHVWRRASTNGLEVDAHATPPLDLAIIEYTWTSSVGQVEALVEALHARRVPVLALLWYHPANAYRFGKVKNDTNPWKNADLIGHQKAFERVFTNHNVPVVDNRELNSRYQRCDRYIMCSERRCQMPLLARSKRHPSRLGHHEIARLVLHRLLESCGELNRQHHQPPSTNYTLATCGIGDELRDAATRVDGFRWDEPDNGRTPAWAAGQAGARLTLELRTSLASGFLSLGVERSWKHQCAGEITCGQGCVCEPREVTTASPGKAYTYTQRTDPVWVMLADSAGARARTTEEGIGGVSALPMRTCAVHVRVAACVRGRFAIRAVMISQPRKGHKSISTATLVNP